MTTNKIFDEIFAIDHSERAVVFKNNIKSAIASYKTNPANIAYIRYLNSQYWDMVFFIIKKKILNTGALDFSDSEMLAIDFGYISDELLDENNDTAAFILNENKPVNKHENLPVICFSISAWLCQQLQNFMGVNKAKEYEKKYETLVNSINNLREEKFIVIESKTKLNKDFCDNPPEGLSKSDIDKIMGHNQKIEKVLENYGLLRSRIQNELLLKKSERVEFVNLENLINSTRDERKKICKTFTEINPDYLPRLIFLEDMIIQKEHEIFDVITLIGKNRRNMEEFIYSKKEILDEEKDGFLKDRISAVKNTIDLISKNNKIEPVVFLTQRPDRNIAGKIFEVIDRTVKCDPGLFENKKVKIYGHPDVILAPGRGHGDYDYHINALIIPQFPRTNYNDSILNALALYRWQCDEENRVKNSFAFLKQNKYFTSAPALMQSFIKNYCVYMSKNMTCEHVKEISGFDSETLQWFNSFISKKESGDKPGEDNKADGKVDVKPAEKLNLNKENEIITAQQNAIKGATPDKIPPAPRKPIRLPGEFIIEDQPDEKKDGENNSKNESINTDAGAGPDIDKNLAHSGHGNNLIKKEDNGEKAVRTENVESDASKEVNETISMLLNENSAIIKKRIQSIFNFENILVEPAKDRQKVNITLYNLDAGQIKHFLNLMSLQSKYYKFMSSIIKEEE